MIAKIIFTIFFTLLCIPLACLTVGAFQFVNILGINWLSIATLSIILMVDLFYIIFLIWFIIYE